jgi:hypothetical protein
MGAACAQERKECVMTFCYDCVYLIVAFSDFVQNM